MNQSFSRNVIELLSTNLELKGLKRKEKIEVTVDTAKERWERLTHYMLNIQNIQERNNPEEGLSHNIIQMLLHARLIAPNPEYSQG